MLSRLTSLTGFHNRCYKTSTCIFSSLAEDSTSLVPKRSELNSLDNVVLILFNLIGLSLTWICCILEVNAVLSLLFSLCQQGC